MSSINPVFVLPGALRERGEEVAGEFATSCLMGAGQFCTNPGLVVVRDDEAGRAFVEKAAGRLGAAPAGVLLGEGGPRLIQEAVGLMVEKGAQIVVGGSEETGAGYSFQNTLLRVSGEGFLREREALQTEAFGSVSLFVMAKDDREMVEIAGALEGNLTGTIYSDKGGSDDELYGKVEAELRPKVGRLLNDKIPTGVAVSPGMVHGGPPPATGHPGFTAVGIPGSLVRFAALHGYDNVMERRLPEELREKNPTGRMWRFIDGEWTQE
jgi:NADP-dependent aldehyde dehydrogenase